ncbi:hypothetical protein [Desulfobulbus oligotrophicus]|uniref:Uncharacterized protein n=1 Tax=Desulfobulbus oligotrophicus TaxID=1909699 RepID=A0A7T5VEI8_9BACT|nr:hypothetical protein [Desulfobulbus oligotrophicus]QQG66341.1 hypothetical protein HP555_10920 [Desulfobulbus oligotrophicus]
MSHSEINEMVGELVRIGLDENTISCLVRAAIDEQPRAAMDKLPLYQVDA